MNSHDQRAQDFVNGDPFHADDYHQDYKEGIYQTNTIGPGVIASILVIIITVVYQILVNLNYDLLPPSQLAWNALVYITPMRLLEYVDDYTSPFRIADPNMKNVPRTHSEKSEIMRRLFGLDTPGGIIDTVASAGRRRLSSLPLIGLGPGGAEEVPAGLGNWDNSCYQNSVLQGLASLDLLPGFLQSLRSDGSNTEAMKMANALQELITTLKNPSNNGRRIWTPATLKNMSSWQQQDAQEYFSGLLGAIDKEHGVAAKSHGVSGLEQVKDLKDKGENTPEHHSFSENPLNGATATRVVCTKCGYSEGLKITPSLCVPLIVGDGWEYHLSELLHEGTKLDYVQGVYCERCTLRKSHHLLSMLMERLKNEPEDSRIRKNTSERLQAVTEALEDDDFSEKTLKEKCKIPTEHWVTITKSKQDIIARPPKSLALHLNRSTYTPEGELTKKTAAIRFPKYLDLGPFSLGSAADKESADEEWPLTPLKSMVAGIEHKSRIRGPFYELRAVITHQGRHENGHYICYRKHPVPETKVDESGKRHDQWWRLSDDHVMKVSEENVLGQGGVFMIFYDQIRPAVYVPPTAEDAMVEEITAEDMRMIDISLSDSSRPVPVPLPSSPKAAGNAPLPEAEPTDISLPNPLHPIPIPPAESPSSSLESHPPTTDSSPPTTTPDTPTTQSELDEEESEAGLEADEDQDPEKEDGEYSPTKAILVPKPYLPGPGLGEKNREQGRSGSAGGLVGNLVMV
ncbi:ubiquitin carboxyl-terminal hydrolase protein [Rutstroemia sp. NJR-2017a BVV2]|nr:ubiquitin carboxyl-terminal hydrolase protein [Rutstroemia sp. NJR-2017a BVV2]